MRREATRISWPTQTPDTLTRELLTPGDAAIVRYREYLKDWQNRGWRIDQQAANGDLGNRACVIPCPARRESGNWILDSIPLMGRN